MIHLRILERVFSILALFCVLAAWITPAVAITGGELDGEGHPNVCAVMITPVDYPPHLFCSGVLISENMVLTAGHATQVLEQILGNVPVYVSFDAENDLVTGPWPKTEWIEVDAAVTHPECNIYTHTSDTHDVGLLILKDPATGITPAVLPDEGFLDQLREDGKLRERGEGAKFTAVGYGSTLDWPPREECNPPDGTRRFARPEYLNVRKVWLHLSQNQAPGRDDSGSCYGDSGGPVFWTEPDGAETVVAIITMGDARCAAISTNYRVDIPDTLDFIDDVITIVGGNASGAPPGAGNRLATALWSGIRSEY
jgi:hypothetical protein